MPERLAIAALPHSGTTWASTMMSGMGLRVGHETAFGARQYCPDALRSEDGDVSCHIPYWWPLVDHRGWILVHLVRNPLHVVRSMLTSGMVDRLWESRFACWMHDVDGPRNVPDFVGWAVLRVNQIIESLGPALRIRVESPDWVRLFGLVDHPYDEDLVCNAGRYARRVPGARAHESVGWDDLPAVLREQAARYGYPA